MSLALLVVLAAAPLKTTDALVDAVWADDAGHVLVVGKAGRAFESSTSGATWTAKPIPTKLDLHGVWSDGAGNAVAVGDGGIAARLEAKTHAWTTTIVGEGLPLHAVWGDGAWVFAVGGARDTGIIAWSADGGARWNHTIVHDTVLRAVGGRDPDHVIAVGTQGAIYGTSSRFAWHPIVVPFIAHSGSGTSTSNPLVLDDYVDVRFDHGTWLALGYLGYIVESKDDGATWTQLANQWGLGGLVFHRGRDLVMVGPAEHSVLHDGVWSSKDAHLPARLGHVWRTPKGVIYSAAFHGGMTSNPIYYSNSGCPMGSTPASCPALIDVPYAGAVLRSADDGLTWTSLVR